MHRLDLSLYSYLKEFWGNGVRTHVNSKGKIHSTGKQFSPEEDGTHDAASSRTASPTHYQRAILHPPPPPPSLSLVSLLSLTVYLQSTSWICVVDTQLKLCPAFRQATFYWQGPAPDVDYAVDLASVTEITLNTTDWRALTDANINKYRKGDIRLR